MSNREWFKARRLRAWLSVALAALVTFGVGVTVFTGTSSAAITGVIGSAYGYYSNIGLFGGAPTTCGSPSVTPCPNPDVTLPSTGSATPLTASIPSATVVYGPAEIFNSGPITVSTQGTPASGTVTSSSSIGACTTAVSNGCTVGQIYAGPFTATSLSSTCTASASGNTGSVTVVGGALLNGTSPAYVIPTNPAPNTTYTGINPDTGATYTWIFNQQTVNSDGSLTITAAHEVLNSNAKGDLLLGQVTCGLIGTPTTTTVAPTTTTLPATTTTLPATTTTLPATTTTLPATTTTLPATTTPLPATTTTL
ncbi:MAG TPA: hypothetical protein VG184_07115, partial [Acidimicrobiales bacterium]|nr:hypothetical protein [Acidimicrobiales bacterium]